MYKLAVHIPRMETFFLQWIICCKSDLHFVSSGSYRSFLQTIFISTEYSKRIRRGICKKVTQQLFILDYNTCALENDIYAMRSAQREKLLSGPLFIRPWPSDMFKVVTQVRLVQTHESHLVNMHCLKGDFEKRKMVIFQKSNDHGYPGLKLERYEKEVGKMWRELWRNLDSFGENVWMRGRLQGKKSRLIASIFFFFFFYIILQWPLCNNYDIGSFN